MWFFNQAVNSVFANTAGGAQAAVGGAGFRVIASGAGQNNVVTVLSNALGNGRLVHVFVNAANQITAVQMI
jgi:hypothetical protein